MFVGNIHVTIFILLHYTSPFLRRYQNMIVQEYHIVKEKPHLHLHVSWIENQRILVSSCTWNCVLQIKGHCSYIISLCNHTQKYILCIATSVHNCPFLLFSFLFSFGIAEADSSFRRIKWIIDEQFITIKGFQKSSFVCSDYIVLSSA